MAGVGGRLAGVGAMWGRAVEIVTVAFSSELFHVKQLD